jgi:hypothetical protein
LITATHFCLLMSRRRRAINQKSIFCRLSKLRSVPSLLPFSASYYSIISVYVEYEKEIHRLTSLTSFFWVMYIKCLVNNWKDSIFHGETFKDFLSRTQKRTKKGKSWRIWMESSLVLRFYVLPSKLKWGCYTKKGF